MQEHARHPDLFTAAEAAVYLHLADNLEAAQSAKDWERTLETLRADGLRGVKMGRGFMYHREDLDAVILKKWNIQAGTRSPLDVMRSRRAAV
jgi:hypothetical protein